MSFDLKSLHRKRDMGLVHKLIEGKKLKRHLVRNTGSILAFFWELVPPLEGFVEEVHGVV